MAMQYIDAAMVGSLGANASASIGLVSTSTWLMGGLCISVATGFSVQAAHLIGGGRLEEAKNVLRQSLLAALAVGLLLCAAGVSISGWLPVWLGGEEAILEDASSYFFIYACALPAVQMRQLSGSMLQCSGNMKTPSMLNALMCGLDVVFNWLLIFPDHHVLGITIPGADMGVAERPWDGPGRMGDCHSHAVGSLPALSEAEADAGGKLETDASVRGSRGEDRRAHGF